MLAEVIDGTTSERLERRKAVAAEVLDIRRASLETETRARRESFARVVATARRASRRHRTRPRASVPSAINASSAILGIISVLVMMGGLEERVAE